MLVLAANDERRNASASNFNAFGNCKMQSEEEDEKKTVDRRRTSSTMALCWLDNAMRIKNELMTDYSFLFA